MENSGCGNTWRQVCIDPEYEEFAKNNGRKVGDVDDWIWSSLVISLMSTIWLALTMMY